jgi:hypothetical protein
MFAGKAKSLSQRGVPLRQSTWIGSVLKRKYYTKLERHARDTHTSLLQKFANNGQRNICPNRKWQRKKGSSFGLSRFVQN